MSSQTNGPILIVEDSPEDFEATLRAIRKSELSNPVIQFDDGDDALDYLFRRGENIDPARTPRPSIILLDLNLPGTGGREVLEEIKNEARLRSIPVIVFSTSADEEDIAACYGAGANSYIHKPIEPSDLVKAIERLKNFWFEVVKTPPAKDSV